jgi:adenosine deaminase
MSAAAEAPPGRSGSRSLPELRRLLYHLPKVDLHRHLEGSLRLETLADIAREHGIDLPSYEIEHLRPYVQITNDPPDFGRFLEKFRLLRRFYTTREAVERVAYEAVIDAAADNVRYLELRFNPAALSHAQGFDFAEVTDWVIEAVNRAQAESSIVVRLLCTLVRHEPIDLAERTIDVALARRARGIVGVDLAGDEVRFPAAPFRDLFRRAAEGGLGITIHAGEAGGADNVREAIELLGAQRIGHGIRAIENSDVVKLVRDRQVALEVCPTSNLQTGVMRKFGHHPLRDLYLLGVPVTINTDDPSVSDTTLTDEYLVAIMGMDIMLENLRAFNQNSLQAAFLPPAERDQLMAQVMSEFDQQIATAK